MYRYYDYVKAYYCLLHAQEISAEVDYPTPSIALSLGLIFSSIGEQSRDTAALNKALDYMRTAFWQAVRARDCSVVNMAFVNAVTLAWTLAKTNALKKEWRELRRMHNTDRPEFTQYNLFYYQAFQNAMAHHYGQAQSLLDKQLRLMPDDNTHVSYICVTLTNKAKLMAAKGNLPGAIQQSSRVILS